jgi:pyrroloquinoline quinone (PQQ) biosynthesis protein C
MFVLQHRLNTRWPTTSTRAAARYGEGLVRERGWFGMERERWGKLFGLGDADLDFFEIHEAADLEHSELGGQAVARFAEQYRMEEAVVEACRVNLMVWERYLDRIAEAGDAS